MAEALGALRLAVRSSSVLEDGDAMALAGVYDSFLGVAHPDSPSRGSLRRYGADRA